METMELEKERPPLTWCNLLSMIWRWRNAAFMVAAVFIDSLLTWKVYFYSDIAFFICGLSFTVLPILVISIGLLCQNGDTPYIQHIPLLNILYILSLDNNKTKIMQIALSVLMSLPQYLLNDTFILSQRHLTLYNKLQLLASYIVIMFSPLINFSFIMFKEIKEQKKSDCDDCGDIDSDDTIDLVNDIKKLKKLKKLHIDIDIQKREKHKRNKLKQTQTLLVSYCDDIKLYLLKALLPALIVLPLIGIELIHFFPVLFEYCYYDNIGAVDLMGNMILFNVPKFPIAMMVVWIAMEHNNSLKDNKNGSSSSSKIQGWCGWDFWLLIGLFLWSLITPLIVAIAVIKSEYNVHKTMLFLSIAYIITSYGGMCAWLVLAVQPQYYGLGWYTKVTVVIIGFLIFFNILILFLVDWYEYYRKGSKSKFITLPYDIQDELDYETEKLVQI